MADEGRATEGDGRESPAEDQGQDGDSDKQTTTPTIDNQSDSNISHYQQHQPDWIDILNTSTDATEPPSLKRLRTDTDSDATRLNSDIVIVSPPRPPSTDSDATIPLSPSSQRPTTLTFKMTVQVRLR